MPGDAKGTFLEAEMDDMDSRREGTASQTWRWSEKAESRLS